MWKLSMINMNLDEIVWLLIKNANPYTSRNALTSAVGEISLTEKQDLLTRLPWSTYLLPASC